MKIKPYKIYDNLIVNYRKSEKDLNRFLLSKGITTEEFFLEDFNFIKEFSKHFLNKELVSVQDLKEEPSLEISFDLIKESYLLFENIFITYLFNLPENVSKEEVISDFNQYMYTIFTFNNPLEELIIKLNPKTILHEAEIVNYIKKYISEFKKAVTENIFSNKFFVIILKKLLVADPTIHLNLMSSKVSLDFNNPNLSTVIAESFLDDAQSSKSQLKSCKLDPNKLDLLFKDKMQEEALKFFKELQDNQVFTRITKINKDLNGIYLQLKALNQSEIAVINLNMERLFNKLLIESDIEFTKEEFKIIEDSIMLSNLENKYGSIYLEDFQNNLFNSKFKFPIMKALNEVLSYVSETNEVEGVKFNILKNPTLLDEFEKDFKSKFSLDYILNNLKDLEKHLEKFFLEKLETIISSNVENIDKSPYKLGFYFDISEDMLCQIINYALPTEGIFEHSLQFEQKFIKSLYTYLYTLEKYKRCVLTFSLENFGEDTQTLNLESTYHIQSEVFEAINIQFYSAKEKSALKKPHIFKELNTKFEYENLHAIAEDALNLLRENLMLDGTPRLNLKEAEEVGYLLKTPELVYQSKKILRNISGVYSKVKIMPKQNYSVMEIPYYPFSDSLKEDVLRQLNSLKSDLVTEILSEVLNTHLKNAENKAEPLGVLIDTSTIYQEMFANDYLMTSINNKIVDMQMKNKYHNNNFKEKLIETLVKTSEKAVVNKVLSNPTNKVIQVESDYDIIYEFVGNILKGFPQVKNKLSNLEVRKLISEISEELFENESYISYKKVSLESPSQFLHKSLMKDSNFLTTIKKQLEEFNVLAEQQGYLKVEEVKNKSEVVDLEKRQLAYLKAVSIDVLNEFTKQGFEINTELSEEDLRNIKNSLKNRNKKGEGTAYDNLVVKSENTFSDEIVNLKEYLDLKDALKTNCFQKFKSLAKYTYVFSEEDENKIKELIIILSDIKDENIINRLTNKAVKIITENGINFKKISSNDGTIVYNTEHIEVIKDLIRKYKREEFTKVTKKFSQVTLNNFISSNLENISERDVCRRNKRAEKVLEKVKFGYLKPYFMEIDGNNIFLLEDKFTNKLYFINSEMFAIVSYKGFYTPNILAYRTSGEPLTEFWTDTIKNIYTNEIQLNEKESKVRKSDYDKLFKNIYFAFDMRNKI